jgi:hypothetical protein
MQTIGKPTSERPKDTLQGSAVEDPSQTGASGYKSVDEGNTLLRGNAVYAVNRSDDFWERVALFRRAVLYLENRRGGDAVVRAFGDPDPLGEAWGLGLEEFKGFLRARIKSVAKTQPEKTSETSGPL